MSFAADKQADFEEITRRAHRCDELRARAFTHRGVAAALHLALTNCMTEETLRQTVLTLAMGQTINANWLEAKVKEERL